VLKQLLEKVVAGKNLAEEEAGEAMEIIMTGMATPAQIAALLTALRFKGETEDEITGFARVMRSKATPVKYSHPMMIDTCGTGGDGCSTFNISTTVALVLAGAGAKVAKHGNRSVSSSCGSADVLEALGVNLDLQPENLVTCLEKVGFAFLYAPALHTAMKHAAGPRRELGFRTIFNILGPLTNPAGAKLQVLGVYRPELTRLLAGVLARLGTEKAFVIHGHGGLDEISPSGPALICEVREGQVKEYYLDPGELGIPKAPVSSLVGGSPEENAIITEDILNGKKGPPRDTVLVNAAAALVICGKAGNFAEGINVAAEIIDSGLAMSKLQELVTFSRTHARKQVSGL